MTRARTRLAALDAARIGIQQVSLAAGMLRAHLRECRRGECIVVAAGADLFQGLEGGLVDAARRGSGSGRPQLMDGAVPDHDVVLMHDQIGRIEFVRQPEHVRIGARVLGIETQDAVVHLIEQEQAAVIIDRQRLRSADFGIFGGIDDADRILVRVPPANWRTTMSLASAAAIGTTTARAPRPTKPSNSGSA